MPLVTLALHAMATRFELVMNGDNPTALRAAGEEALQEIESLEGRLSLFRPESEIAHVNARAACEPVRVTPEVFSLLQQAQRLHRETGGAFDITIAPLVRCWGFMDGRGSLPRPSDLAAARAKVGMGWVRLSPQDYTVRFAREGVMLDLGAIGKGYAIERATQCLREAGVTSALLHGGTSTVYALGHPPGQSAWKVAIEDPRCQPGRAGPSALPAASPHGDANSPSQSFEPTGSDLAIVSLKDEALSVSAPRGRFFEVGGRIYGHVLDPRTGWPANTAVSAAVVLPSATETDALSTALLIVGPEGHDRIARLRPGMRTLLATAAGAHLHLDTRNL